MSKKEEGEGQEKRGSHREAVGRGGMSGTGAKSLLHECRAKFRGSHLINSTLPHK